MGKRWTVAEDAALEQWAGDAWAHRRRQSLADLAAHFGRTHSAVRKRVSRLRVGGIRTIDRIIEWERVTGEGWYGD